MQRFGLKPMAVVVFVVMTACNFPRSPLPTPDLNATVAAKVRDTLTASSPTASPRGPSATPSKPPSMPTVVPSPSPAPPAQTPSPAPSRLVVSVETNCRKGPGEAFERIGVLLVGQEAEVLGRSTSGDYWVVRLPDGHVCWLWGQYATVTGDRPIPPMTPPPTPGLATVKGRIFHDTNRNGKQDAGEAPFSGLTVWLTAATGGQCVGPNLAQTSTTAQGDYHFQVAPATYCVTLPGGPPWCAYGINGASMGGAVLVSLHPGQVLTLDFGDLGCSPYDPSCKCP